MTNRYDRYEQLRANGPILVQRGLQGTAYYIIGYQEAKQILGDHKRFVKDFRNTLLRRIPTIRLSVPASQLKYNEGPVVRGLVRLPVSWDMQNPT